MILQHLQPGRDRAPSTSTGTSSGLPPLSSARGGVWKEDLQLQEARGKGPAELSAATLSRSPCEPLQLHKDWLALTSGRNVLTGGKFCI